MQEAELLIFADQRTLSSARAEHCFKLLTESGYELKNTNCLEWKQKEVPPDLPRRLLLTSKPDSLEFADIVFSSPFAEIGDTNFKQYIFEGARPYTALTWTPYGHNHSFPQEVIASFQSVHGWSNGKFEHPKKTEFITRPLNLIFSESHSMTQHHIVGELATHLKRQKNAVSFRSMMLHGRPDDSNPPPKDTHFILELREYDEIPANTLLYHHNGEASIGFGCAFKKTLPDPFVSWMVREILPLHDFAVLHVPGHIR